MSCQMIYCLKPSHLFILVNFVYLYIIVLTVVMYMSPLHIDYDHHIVQNNSSLFKKKLTFAECGCVLLILQMQVRFCKCLLSTVHVSHENGFD